MSDMEQDTNTAASLAQEHLWRRCPNCRREHFFVDVPETGLRFLRIDLPGAPFSTGKPPEPRPDLAPLLNGPQPTEIHCTSCGWRGKPGDLTIPVDVPPNRESTE